MTTPTMTTYLVKRHGSNAANQSMTEVMPVAIVEATDRDDASRLVQALDDFAIQARVDALEAYNGQWLEFVPRSRASARDWNAVLEGDALRRLYPY